MDVTLVVVISYDDILLMCVCVPPALPRAFEVDVLDEDVFSKSPQRYLHPPPLSPPRYGQSAFYSGINNKLSFIY